MQRLARATARRLQIWGYLGSSGLTGLFIAAAGNFAAGMTASHGFASKRMVILNAVFTTATVLTSALHIRRLQKPTSEVCAIQSGITKRADGERDNRLFVLRDLVREYVAKNCKVLRPGKLVTPHNNTSARLEPGAAAEPVSPA